MPRLQTIHKFGAMDKDTPFAQRSQDTYWEAENIKIINNGATKSVTKHEGFDIEFVLPEITETYNKILNEKYINYIDPITKGQVSVLVNPLGENNATKIHSELSIVGITSALDQVILVAVSKEGMTFIFSYYNNEETDGAVLKLHFANYISMSNDRKIEIVSNYETSEIIKIYWVDGTNQLRHFNIADTNTLLMNPILLDLSLPTKFTSPVVIEPTSGPAQIAGVVTYCYSLYNLSGQVTKISPLSIPYSLIDYETGRGGGTANEKDSEYEIEDVIDISTTVNATIPEIDTNYEFIKIYVIKYLDEYSDPVVRLIQDSRIQSYTNYSFIDDGSASLQDGLTVNNLRLQGAEVFVPQHIESKNNRLLLANYSKKEIDVDIDCRVFRYNKNQSTTLVYDSASHKTATDVSATKIPKYNHTCYNDKEDIMYKRSSVSLGATGKHFELSVNEREITIDSEEDTNTPNFSEDPIYYPDDYRLNASVTPNTVHDGEGTIIFTLDQTTIDILNAGAVWKVGTGGTITPVGNTAFSVVAGDLVQVIPQELAPEVNTLELVEIVEGVTPVKTISEKTFKQGENYRFGVEFYRTDGSVSDVKWLCDYRFPYKPQATQRRYTVSLNMFGDSRGIVAAQGVSSYKLLYVERGPRDRSIVSQGFVQPLMRFRVNNKTQERRQPYMHMKDITSAEGGEIIIDYRQGVDYEAADSRTMRADHTNVAFWSPEILFGISIPEITTIRKYGAADGFTTNSVSYQTNCTNIIPNEAVLTAKGLKYGADYMDARSNEDNDRGTYIGAYRHYNDLQILPKSGNNKTKYYKFPGVDTDIELAGPVGVVDTTKTKTIGGINVAGGTTKNNQKVGGASGRMNEKRSIYFDTAPFLLLRFKDTTWSKKFGLSGRNYCDFELFPRTTDRRSIPIVELITSIPTQYGGITYSDRQRNMYQSLGTVADIGNIKSVSEMEGDTFLTTFRIQRIYSQFLSNADAWAFDDYVEVQHLESNINLSTRYDLLDDSIKNEWLNQNISPFTASGDNVSKQNISKLKDGTLYNPVYDRSISLFPNFAKPEGTRTSEARPSTILISDRKIINEKTDNYLAFDILSNNLTLPSKYGEINKLHKSSDNVLSFQRSAISYLSIDPRIQVQGSDNISIGLGTGNPLDDYKYITTKSGTIHPWSVINTNSAVMYFDYDNRNVSLVNDPPSKISDTSGISQYLKDYIKVNPQLHNEVNTVKNGIVFHYDSQSENNYLTFNGKEPITISFNNLITAPVSFHKFKPQTYMEYRGKLHLITDDVVKRINYDKFTESALDEVGNIIEEKYNMSMTLLNTESAIFVKRFDNIEVDTSVSFNTIQCWNSYQDTGEVKFKGYVSVLRKRLALPRAAKRQRLRDDHLFIKLKYDGVEQMSFEYLSLTYNIAKGSMIDS